MNTRTCLHSASSVFLWVQFPIPVRPVPEFLHPLHLPAKLGGCLDGLGRFCRGDLELCTCQYWGAVPAVASMMRLLLYLPYVSITTVLPKALLFILRLPAPVLLSAQ